MSVPAIETPRLVMREWRDDDLEPLARVLADPEVTRYLFGSPLDLSGTRDAVDRRCEHWAETGIGYWALELKDNGELAGWAGLQPVHHFPDYLGEIEAGWMLARELWGRGLATEAGARSLRYGFTDVGLDRIVGFHISANRRSQRVMERLGMRPAGETLEFGGTAPDLVRLITRDQWHAARRNAVLCAEQRPGSGLGLEYVT